MLGYRTVDFLKRLFFRGVVGTLVIAGVAYLLWLVVYHAHIWSAFGLEEVDIGTVLSTRNLLTAFIILGLGGLAMDMLNEHLLDKMNAWFDGWLMRRRWPGSSFFAIKFMERTTKKMHVVGLSHLDEVINRMYGSASGKICLFNPSRELITSTKKEWVDARLAIRDNITRITQLVITVPQGKGFPTKADIAFALEIPDAKVIVKEVTGTWADYAGFCRFGLYYQKEARGEVVEYFLYRPIKLPYNDSFVMIQGRSAFKTMRIPDNAGGKDMDVLLRELHSTVFA